MGFDATAEAMDGDVADGDVVDGDVVDASSLFFFFYRVKKGKERSILFLILDQQLLLQFGYFTCARSFHQFNFIQVFVICYTSLMFY